VSPRTRPSDALHARTATGSGRQSRRRLLATGGATAIAALAGCTGVRSLLPRSRPETVDCSGPPESHPWPTYGYDPARTGATPEREFQPADAGATQFSGGPPEGPGNSVDAPPVVGDGTVFVAGDVAVEARDLATGARRWSVDPDDGVATSPALACGVAFVTALNRTYALDRTDGTVRWRTDRGGGVDPAASPTVVDGTVYVPRTGRLEATTGRRLGSLDAGRYAAQGVAAADGVAYASGVNRDEGLVAAVDADGERWTADVGPVYTHPVVADGTVYAVAKDGECHAVDAGDGSVRWSAPIPEGVHDAPAVADGVVVVPAGNGEAATGIDASTGDRLWTVETGPSVGSPAIYGDRALVPGANTGVHAVDLATGERLQRWDVPSVGSTPVVAGGRLFYRAWHRSAVYVVG
jgi:outer membrane protein assembly factor BamB